MNFLSRTSVVIKKAISVDSISILQLSQDENSYSPVYLHGKNISASQMRQFTNDELLLNISNKYISQKFPASDPKVYFSDHLQDDFKIVIPHYFQLRGAKHCCGVIISGAPKKKPYGVLCVFKNKKEKFKKEEVYFLKCVSNIIATTIQRYELENVLEKKVLELNKAHRNKDEFLSVLSHELRTPLNVIIGNLDIIKVYNKNANEYKKGIEAIERNVSSELKLVEDILDVSGIISGKLSIYPKKHSIIDVINYAISIVSIAAQSKKIKIETNYDKNIEQIIGDEGRIRQIIWNLLSNAVKFTNNEGIIKVNVEKVNNNIIVSVKDNGIGLTKAQSKHVFDRFWQEDSSVKRMNTGVGLGLSIVKNLIELHGGSVNCYSAGKSLGTTFTVQLPINRKVNIIKHKKINVIKKINTKKLSKIAYKPKKRLIGKKVALIEDLVDSQIIYKFYLEAESANLDIFGSAKPALKKLVKNPYSYDIIISDIGLPDLSGYEFIKKVRELQSNSNTDKDPTKSLSLSAYARDIDREKALKAGFNDHLVKPVRAEQLIFCILDLINKPN